MLHGPRSSAPLKGCPSSTEVACLFCIPSAAALPLQVLETYTDITRFPPPKQPQAAIIVGAKADRYVDPQVLVPALAVQARSAVHPPLLLAWRSTGSR